MVSMSTPDENIPDATLSDLLSPGKTIAIVGAKDRPGTEVDMTDPRVRAFFQGRKYRWSPASDAARRFGVGGKGKNGRFSSPRGAATPG